jgi:hypothetical protein
MKYNIYTIKWKTKNTTLGTNPKSNIKIVERGKIGIPNSQIYDCVPSCLGTDTSKKVAGDIKYQFGNIGNKDITI